MQITSTTTLLATCLAVLLGLVLCVSANQKDGNADGKVTFDGVVADLPSQYVELHEKRAGNADKWNRAAFNDYAHLRFGRSDPALIASDDLPPFYRYPPFAPLSYAEKRASFGSDYNHLRFGRRVPSFTDYGTSQGLLLLLTLVYTEFGRKLNRIVF